MQRSLFLVLGLLMVGIAAIGAVLPVMPTTIFLILAAGCFARSSPRLEAWLLDHPRFGPTLRDWRAEGAIRPRAKLAAFAGMAFGYGIFLVASKPEPWLALTVGAGMLGCAIYVGTRPSGGRR